MFSLRPYCFEASDLPQLLVNLGFTLRELLLLLANGPFTRRSAFIAPATTGSRQGLIRFTELTSEPLKNAHPGYASRPTAIKTFTRLSLPAKALVQLWFLLLKIVEVFRSGRHACYQQVLPRPRACDVQQATFGLIDVVQLGFVG